jgi:hypothetical protein
MDITQSMMDPEQYTGDDIGKSANRLQTALRAHA